MSKSTPLFTPIAVAGHELPHRVVMAPMTRARSTQPYGASATANDADAAALRAAA